MENKVASLENIDELENESPRSLFSSSVSELPTVRDFSFIKPIAKGGYRCESFLLSPFSFPEPKNFSIFAVGFSWRGKSKREICSRSRC